MKNENLPINTTELAEKHHDGCSDPNCKIEHEVKSTKEEAKVEESVEDYKKRSKKELSLVKERINIRKHLKRAKYDTKTNIYDKAYVIENKKTKTIIEVKASSSTHACSIAGWRPRHTKLIDIINVKERDEKALVEKSKG
jgi:hypothetical protein